MSTCRNCGQPVGERSGVCPNCGAPAATPEGAAGPEAPGDPYAGALGFILCWAAFAAVCWGGVLSFGHSIIERNEARGGGPYPPVAPPEPYFAAGSIGLVATLVAYLLLRRRYHAFAAGLGCGLLSVGVVALGGLLVCGVSNLLGRR